MNKFLMIILRLLFIGYIAFMTYQTLMAHKRAEKNFLGSLKAFESSTKKRHPALLPHVKKFSSFI